MLDDDVAGELGDLDIHVLGRLLENLECGIAGYSMERHQQTYGLTYLTATGQASTQ